MTKSNYPRRDFIKNVASGIAVSSCLPFIDQLARAQTQEGDEHFFIFVELVGGAHCMIGTDGRDPATLPLNDPSKAVAFEITDTPPTQELVTKWQTDSNQEAVNPEGNFILQPFIGDMASSYKIGKTAYNKDGKDYEGRYVLGPAGLGLADVVNDMAVIRGIKMQGSFHPRKEIFSGSDTVKGTHLASALAQLLQNDPRYGGPKLLDNVVFEFGYSEQTAQGLAPVKVDGQSLAALTSFMGQGGAADHIFARAQKITEAMSRGIVPAHREVLGNYVTGLSQAPFIGEKLRSVSFASEDISLMLDKQFEAAVTLIQSGLSRVITLCLGANNGKNMVDGFGLFDSHVGVYHIDPGDTSRGNINRQHLTLGRTLNQVAAFIKLLKATKYKNTNRSLFDMTTVVVGSDYARTSTLEVSELNLVDDKVPFGCGHNFKNNNYLLFGKGVKGGAWIGNNDPVRQWGDFVDMQSLNTPDVSKIITQSSVNESGMYRTFAEGDNLRPFMVKDVMKTILSSAGYENKYAQYYSEADFPNAQVITPIKAS